MNFASFPAENELKDEDLAMRLRGVLRVIAGRLLWSWIATAVRGASRKRGNLKLQQQSASSGICKTTSADPMVTSTILEAGDWRVSAYMSYKKALSKDEHFIDPFRTCSYPISG